MQNIQLSSEITIVALKAAVLAGAEIMEVHGGNLHTRYKEDDSPVTLADQRAHEAILKTLQITGIPVLSEEMAAPDFGMRRQWQQYWLVDPLDGTKEFVRGGEDFTVNIALMENNHPVMGIIVLPASGRVYVGGTAMGATYKAKLKTLEWTPGLKTSFREIKPEKTANKIGVAVSISHLSEDTLAYVGELRRKYGEERVEILRRGGAVKFCLLAEGNAMMYPRFSPCMEWDTAAGQAICEATGATMKRFEDMQPLEYNKKSLLNPPFIITTKAFEQAFVE